MPAQLCIDSKKSMQGLSGVVCCQRVGHRGAGNSDRRAEIPAGKPSFSWDSQCFPGYWKLIGCAGD